MECLVDEDLRAVTHKITALDESKIKRRGRKSAVPKEQNREEDVDVDVEKPKSLSEVCGGSIPSLDESTAAIDVAYAESSRLGAVSRKLCEVYRAKLFHRWVAELAAGFSIVLYGVGSKIQLLDDFVQLHLADYATVTIRGYATRSFTFAKLLRAIRSACKLRDSDSFASEAEEVKRIGQHLEKSDQLVFLAFHNLDAPSFREGQFQVSLSKLISANRDHICLISTVDHTNSMLLWDEYALNRFRYLFYDTTTYYPYSTELAADVGCTSLFSTLAAASGTQKRGSTEQQLAALRSVMESVPLNARSVFAILARAHLRELATPAEAKAALGDEDSSDASPFENEEADAEADEIECEKQSGTDSDERERSASEAEAEAEADTEVSAKRKTPKRKSAIVAKRNMSQSRRPVRNKKQAAVKSRRKELTYGMTFDDLFDAARAQMVVANEATLRAHLNEFADHELVRWKRPGDGATSYADSLDAERIQMLISQETLTEYLNSTD